VRIVPVVHHSQPRAGVQHRVVGRDRHGALSRPARFRLLALAAVTPAFVGYLAVAAVLALVTAIAENAKFSVVGVLAMAVPGWLAAYHVPLGLGTHSLAVLPLVPTALLMVGVARTARTAAARLGLSEPAQARLVVLPVAGVHALFGVTVALSLGSGPVTATPAVAFFGCGALSGFAATVGVARRCNLVEVAFARLDPIVTRGLRAGALGIAAMFTAGTAVLTFGLVAHWTTLAAVFQRAASGVGGACGLLLLSVAYLPNAIVMALSFAMGPGFTMGAASISPVRLAIDKAPGVPLFAALPTVPSRWLLAVMVVPLLVGVFLGWSCRQIAPAPRDRLRAVVVAAGVVGMGLFVLAALSGGRLGGGVFSPVTAPAGLVGVVAFAWVLIPASVTVWLAGARSRPVPEGQQDAPVDGEQVQESVDSPEDNADSDDKTDPGQDDAPAAIEKSESGESESDEPDTEAVDTRVAGISVPAVDDVDTAEPDVSEPEQPEPEEPEPEELEPEEPEPEEPGLVAADDDETRSE